jgi:DNA-directed RNA polymerase specialized sigma24 family protein
MQEDFGTPALSRGNIVVNRMACLDSIGAAAGDLVQQFRQGDRDAFTELYRANHPAMFRFALNMTGDRGKAGELTQDVFVWLIHHAADFDPQRGELGAFLIGVARKLLLRTVSVRLH